MKHTRSLAHTARPKINIYCNQYWGKLVATNGKIPPTSAFNLLQLPSCFLFPFGVLREEKNTQPSQAKPNTIPNTNWGNCMYYNILHTVHRRRHGKCVRVHWLHYHYHYVLRGPCKMIWFMLTLIQFDWKRHSALFSHGICKLHYS